MGALHIDLGTCVQFPALMNGDPAPLGKASVIVEGVVIEVVRLRHRPRLVSRAVWVDRSPTATTYVVQCDGWRVLLKAREMAVVAW